MFSIGFQRGFNSRKSGVMHKQLSHRRLALVFFGFAFVLPVSGAYGQTFTRNQDYFRDVVTLSETLGKAHAVRVICNGRNDQYWRGYMQRLIQLEAPYSGGLRTSMVNGFNAGFSTGSAIHTSCNAETIAAEKTYAATGRDLTRDLASANIPSSVVTMDPAPEP